MRCIRRSRSEGFLICAVLAAGVALARGQQPPEDPPFKLPPGVSVESDLVYARYGARELQLDLYRPSSGDGPFPGAIFIHGGGWSAGGRNAFRRQAAYLASQGFVCVTIEYRLSKEAPYPAAVYDCKASVRWMRANAGHYRLNPDQIAAAGGSAGGHLAAMLGTTKDDRNLEGDGGNAGFSSRVQAVVAFNGVFDFVSLLTRTQQPQAVRDAVLPFLGGPLDQIPEVWMQASPVAHVSGECPPFLFLHGTGDKTAPYEQTLEMQKALQDVGVRVEVYTAEGADHGFFNRPPYFQPTLLRMEQFLRSVFNH